MQQVGIASPANDQGMVYLGLYKLWVFLLVSVCGINGEATNAGKRDFTGLSDFTWSLP